jgi:ATP-dependent DNA ligase
MSLQLQNRLVVVVMHTPLGLSLPFPSITNMKIEHSSPILVSKTRTGAEKFWQAHFGSFGTIATGWFTQTSYWQVNKKGVKSKVQFSEPYEATPKNIGKANETTAKEQAHSEFDSMVQKQRDKGYTEPGTKSKVRPLPMLAQKFTERKKKVTYPVLVQPKLDGNRMLQDDGECWSRGGKDMVKAAVNHLTIETDSVIIDGELILPGNVPLEETAQALKAYKPGISEKLTYAVYDLVSDKVYSERLKMLREIVKKAGNKQVYVVPTFVAKNEAEVMAYHKKFVKEGYEGVMIRDDSDGYDVGHRSNQLQKYKDFVDAEFKITGVLEGDGREKGLAIFECVTEEGNTFKARPEGSTQIREEMWKNRKKLVGKWLTVRYQTITKKERVPQFPVGVTIREDGEF